MKNTSITYLYCATALMLAGCGTNVPDNANQAGRQPSIYPDYADVAIPANIAPMNFNINDVGDEYVVNVRTRYCDSFAVAGQVVDMPVDQWHEALEEPQGDSVFIDVYVKDNGKWLQYAPIKMAVVDPIDPYISYRLIEPSYVNFEVMRIRQRSLCDFDEQDIYNNCPYASENEGQCINCHSYQNYNYYGNWQMHVRITNGGTLICTPEGVKKIDLKLSQTISAGVYPAWHPTLPLIAYSNNNTTQIFHYSDPNKIEVQDSESDLILYDVDKGEIRFISNEPNQWETFPAWSPDGKYLYYVSATMPSEASIADSEYRKNHYRDIKYDVYRRAFDADNLTFSQPDTVYSASNLGASATLPRISPDGRYLLFTQAEYGTFHIWHHDADLYLMNLASGEVAPMDAINSPDTESYHSWSSNGRWILFSSRRDDGAFTRLYISYFDLEGNAHKPFMLPQQNPESNIWLYKSYNVPEFMAAPVTTKRNDIIEALAQPPCQSTFVDK